MNSIKKENELFNNNVFYWNTSEEESEEMFCRREHERCSSYSLNRCKTNDSENVKHQEELPNQQCSKHDNDQITAVPTSSNAHVTTNPMHTHVEYRDVTNNIDSVTCNLSVDNRNNSNKDNVALTNTYCCHCEQRESNNNLSDCVIFSSNEVVQSIPQHVLLRHRLGYSMLELNELEREKYSLPELQNYLLYKEHKYNAINTLSRFNVFALLVMTFAVFCEIFSMSSTNWVVISYRNYYEGIGVFVTCKGTAMNNCKRHANTGYSHSIYNVLDNSIVCVDTMSFITRYTVVIWLFGIVELILELVALFGLIHIALRPTRSHAILIVCYCLLGNVICHIIVCALFAHYTRCVRRICAARNEVAPRCLSRFDWSFNVYIAAAALNFLSCLIMTCMHSFLFNLHWHTWSQLRQEELREQCCKTCTHHSGNVEYERVTEKIKEKDRCNTVEQIQLVTNIDNIRKNNGNSRSRNNVKNTNSKRELYEEEEKQYNSNKSIAHDNMDNNENYNNELMLSSTMSPIHDANKKSEAYMLEHSTSRKYNVTTNKTGNVNENVVNSGSNAVNMKNRFCTNITENNIDNHAKETIANAQDHINKSNNCSAISKVKNKLHSKNSTRKVFKQRNYFTRLLNREYDPNYLTAEELGVVIPHANDWVYDDRSDMFYSFEIEFFYDPLSGEYYNVALKT